MRHHHRPCAALLPLGLAVLIAACGPTASPRPSGTGSADPSPSPTASPTATPAPTPGPVAIVPVGDYRTTVASVGPEDLAAVLDGTSKTYHALELVAADSGAVMAALGMQAPADATRLVLADSAEVLATDLAAHRDRLAFLRASQVGPSVHALQWQGKGLFGVDRVASLSDWTLNATLLAGDPATTYDPASAWTIVAGGDVMFDRNVYIQSLVKRTDVDFPFKGGTVKITGTRCCSKTGWDPYPMATFKRLGGEGAVTHLLSGADLTLLNLEGPAPKNATHHTDGTSMSFDQRLLPGLVHAGVDWVSLANNHIRNEGAQGISETIEALDGLAIAHSGAGANSTEARAPAVLTAGGLKIALLSYDNISVSGATSTKAGAALLQSNTYVEDIAAARAAGADLVIVYPHWGTEYSESVTATQKKYAHEMIDAGADLIIGAHPHVNGGMEVYNGKPIWYSLGNFVFDQWWWDKTQKGIVLELTFSGSRLVQAWMHPILIIDYSQPNLVDAGTGSIVMDQTYSASKKLLPW
jgi:poly-gamma-glutamate capsule biosynthesis protein CapA/YwtB (metallophosphatase superfamily)